MLLQVESSNGFEAARCGLGSMIASSQSTKTCCPIRSSHFQDMKLQLCSGGFGRWPHTQRLHRRISSEDFLMRTTPRLSSVHGLSDARS